MQTFLSHVVDDILSRSKSISDYTFVLPSKRAGVFLKEEIKKKSNKAVIFPNIISIEDLISELSSIVLIDNTTLLFIFYKVYRENTPEDKQDDFETFTKWATIALQDFNEIDRHLVDAPHLFSYLQDIQQLEKWSLEEGKETPIVRNYLAFFKRLKAYYSALRKELLAAQFGYQGLLYREAVENLQNYIESSKKKLVLVGFNALNKAEEVIFQELLESNIATIYWDADSYYFGNNQASNFLKKYKNNWKFYQSNEFNWVQDNFNKNKNISIIGAPKNNTQIKYVGELLSQLGDTQFKNTALVLADESLLPLTLNSLPKEVGSINITMGYDLKNIPIAQLFHAILKLQVNAKKNESNTKFYFKDVIRVLSHSSLKKLVCSENIISEILKNNYIFLNEAIMQRFKEIDHNLSSILFLFSTWNNNPNTAITHCISLIDIMSLETNTVLENEFLYKLKAIFQQIETLNIEYNFIKTVKTLQEFYQQLLREEKLSFKGEPLSGLQLMGMLETRVLDFETVILTSVNEGILPAGKSESSFIPYDVKREVELPTYQEKDAIFSYHFYRLLQRAKNIYILYNTESDHYGSGEQSRFITQLEINKTPTITKFLVSPKLVTSKSYAHQIEKTSTIVESLNMLALKGLSPTSLTNYIYNPLTFYHQKILGIREIEDIEETIASNTLGTIIHKSLEALYIPLKGKFLQVYDIEHMKKEVASEVKKWFHLEYKNGDITSGKNLLVFSVAKQFISNFLEQELALLKEGKKLKILHLEYDLETTISIDQRNNSIKLTGQADRIDELDGVLRIIDYKTGKVEQREVSVKDWSLITTDYKKYSKSFQVLLYAFIYAKMNNLNFVSQPIESGIISFKNLKAGLMKVNKRAIQEDDMRSFTIELKQLLSEIFNADIPFIEKENLPF